MQFLSLFKQKYLLFFCVRIMRTNRKQLVTMSKIFATHRSKNFKLNHMHTSLKKISGANFQYLLQSLCIIVSFTLRYGCLMQIFYLHKFYASLHAETGGVVQKRSMLNKHNQKEIIAFLEMKPQFSLSFLVADLIMVIVSK